MEVFMNRNFAKISVAIVALMLVLAFCLTACKADDVAADLDTTKNEVSANKADAAKALEDAVKALEAKIAANEADCAAEIAAVSAAIKAAKDAGAVTDANLESAEKALNAAIAAVKESLDATKTELSNKITANDAKINAEVAALNKAIANAEAALKAADTADKAALEASLAAAKAELDAAIKTLSADIAKLTAYVNDAVAALEADIAAGKKDLTSAVAELTKALDVAAVQTKEADAALKAELEQAIVNATQAIIEVVELADENLQKQLDADKADLKATQDDLNTTKDLLNTLENETLKAIETAYQNADAELAGKIAGLKGELDAANTALGNRITALENVLNGYNAATEAIDVAWKDICAAYDSWKILSETHGADAKTNDTVDKAYELSQIRLGRALTVADVDAAKDEFLAAVAKAQQEVPTLQNLEEVYNNLVAAENAADLVAERTAILAAKAGLDGVANVELVVDGKVVDLAEKYAAACVAYNEERVALVEADIAAAQADIDVADAYADITPIETNINKIKTAVNDLVNDTDIPVETDTTDALSADHVDLLKDVAGAWIEIIAADITNGNLSITSRFTQANRKIQAASEAGADVTALEERVDEVKAARASAYIALAKTAINDATDVAALKAAMANIETNLADAKKDILAVSESAATTAKAEYIAAQQAKIAKMEAVAIAALEAATTLEAVEAVEEYIDEIEAAIAELDEDEDIDVDTAEFEDTCENLAVLVAEKILGFAKAELENAANAEAVEAVAATLAEAKARLDVLAASEKVEELTETYDHLTSVIALVAEGEEVAAIIAGLDATTLAGVKTEYNTINEYKTAYDAFVAKLNELYVGFESTAGYDAIEAVANKVGFEEINTAFEAKIADLAELANDLINKIKAINAKVNQDGYNFAMITDIEAAWEAFHTWEQNATDADGVGFIIEYVSEGAYTNENLNTILVQIQADYDAYVKDAQEAWTACNTDYYKSLTVENIEWDETALELVKVWFETYGTNAADYEIEGVGTLNDYNVFEALNAALDAAKAEREALVKKLAADAAALQERIDNLGFITTGSAADVKDLRDDVNAWKDEVAENAIDFVAEYGEAVDIDEAKLVEAEAKLVDLDNQITNIQGLIADLTIPTIGTDPAAPYFADDTAKDAYIAEVKAITDALAKFAEDNDGYRNCFTDAELAKVEEANPELFVAKYEAALEVYNEYKVAYDSVDNDEARASLDKYLEEAREEIDATGTVATFNTAAVDYVAVLEAICELFAVKCDATVDVYNAYVVACNGITNDEILAKFDAYLTSAIADIDSDDAEAIEAAVELYTAKYEATVEVYTAYEEACNGVSDADATTRMTTYLNEALKQINKANTSTPNYKAYIQQTGTNAANKFNDIKEGAGLPVCAKHTYTNACDAVCDVCFYTRVPEDHVYTNGCDVVCNNCNETTREAGDHVYTDDCDAECDNGCGVTRVAPHKWANDCDAECDCGLTRTITHVDADLDFTCDTVGCGTRVIPAEGTTLTIAQFLALGKITTTTTKYYVTGTVKNVYNFTYGNMYITDGTNELCVYGTYSADGSVRYDKMTQKPVAGDTVTLYGIVSVYQGAVQMGTNSVGNRLTAHVPHEHDYKAADCVNPASCKLCGATTGEALGHTEANAEGKCDRCDATLSSSVKYVKVTNEADFTSGTYVIVCSNGVGLGSLSGGWITTAAPTIVGNEVTDAVGATWTLTVNGSSVTLKDAAGKFIKPAAGNNNGIQEGSYNWAWSMDEDGNVTFAGTGDDTNKLASNTSSQNKFRAYKNGTISGNTAGYPCTFEVYKLAE